MPAKGGKRPAKSPGTVIYIVKERLVRVYQLTVVGEAVSLTVGFTHWESLVLRIRVVHLPKAEPPCNESFFEKGANRLIHF